MEQINNEVDEKYFVSVIIPCYNEEKFIYSLIQDLIKQDYPVDLIEYLIMDGMSTDNTRSIIQEIYLEYKNIKIYDNNKRTQPYAMNLGIQKSRGDIIVRMDVHCSYPKNYISELVRNLIEYNVDNVGGMWVNKPSSNNKIAIAISLATSSVFCIGNAQYRISTKKDPFLVDTVPFGCFKKSLFARIGVFNTSLPRGEDDEFNARIIKNNGKILLIPSIKIVYYTRESIRKLFMMQYQYGLYKPLTNIQNGRLISIRQLIPFLFVIYLFLAPFFFICLGKIYFIFPFILYVFLSLFFSLRKNYKLFLIIMYLFFISHIAYGVGYIMGIITFLFFKKCKFQINITR